MIFIDTTKSANARHRSGLTRVTTRLAAELANGARSVDWNEAATSCSAEDWFFTAELFSERERPGFTGFLASRRCRTAALFHDAIPLKLPKVTWPQSVARHPEYMKLLARFDRVFAVSQASRAELQGFWRWAGVTPTPTVEVLGLGADFSGEPRARGGRRPSQTLDGARAQLLCVGILEPRKNQILAIDAAESLWAQGLNFDLHFVGRVNPHFGAPIVGRIKAAAKRWRGRVFWHEGATDDALRALYRSARATLFPTVAEGCGLPLLESLWMGVPCMCSDLPVLRENADAGGCVPVAVNDVGAWTAAISRVVTDHGYHAELCNAAEARPLATWADCARTLRAALA